MPQLFVAWEESFVVKHWDQPFANSIDELVTEGLKFVAAMGEKPVVLLGISGGTIVGLHMVKRRENHICHRPCSRFQAARQEGPHGQDCSASSPSNSRERMCLVM